VSASGGDIEAGAAKASVCASCHGNEGISNNPLWPSLAGQQEQYLAKQLRAFRDGTRADPLMSPMSKELTDADIDDLAAYYASLE
jgi:cytochrome c553